MTNIYFSEKMMATAFWSELLSSGTTIPAKKEIEDIVEKSAKQLKYFPSEAGTISRDSCLILYLVAKYFSPKTVAEVGTYIGRSTLSVFRGANSSLENLYTCDGTFDCLKFDEFDLINGDRIKYFGKTMSTEMLQGLVDRNIKKLDLLLIDGRVSTKDLDLMENLLSESAVICIDDFEGVEKGVINVIMLREKFRQYLLLEPKFSTLNTSMALLVPSTKIKLTRQQGLPISMS